VVHELSVCQALIAQVELIAAQHAASGVKSVRVRLGPLSGVEAQLLQDAYPIACAGSVAAESVLVIDLAPLKVKCATCGAETEASPNRLLCGKCGDYHTQLVSGDEMLLMSVELLQGVA
jgi:hydrogenase nickel incorporation protein HypA/HybF